METMDIQAVESKLNDVTVTAIPMSVSKAIHNGSVNPGNMSSQATISASITPVALTSKDNGVSKYAQLLTVIEEMGKDVRPSYSGSRSSAERLKRGIVHARILVRECLMETERSARSAMKIENLHTWDTKLNADSVEWCPIENFQHVFVCGTYQLDKSDRSATSAPLPQNRQGRIYLFKIGNDPIQLVLNQTLTSSGVLDQKWSQFLIAGDPVLAVVDSIGHLKIYNLTAELQLVLSSEIRVCDGLALSLDWSTGKYASNEPKIAVSDSKGHVSIYILKESGLERLSYMKAHDFEAWICAFNYWDPQIFFTGGDDCKLNVFDVRRGENAIMVNKSHNSGVTSFHSNKLNESGLISGSYDETLRKWDLRKFKNPIAETPLGGGIWRLKWHPNRDSLVLAACMYGGFRIVDEEESAFNVVAEYNAHESIAYGADWSHSNSLFATCSFYDNKLHLNKLIL